MNNPTPTDTTLSPSSANAGAAAQILQSMGRTLFELHGDLPRRGAHRDVRQRHAVDHPTERRRSSYVRHFRRGRDQPHSRRWIFEFRELHGGQPRPTLASLSPASATAGAAAQTLTINGTNFLSTSTVAYNSAAHTEKFVSATQLTIQFSAADQATAGIFTVEVTNPEPGGGSSKSATFTVNNPAPTISSLSPTSATAGAAAQTLTINGTDFVSISSVTYNGVAHTAKLSSSTQLTITLSASDQATAGTYPVVVTNPAPGGGASNAVNFTVSSANNPVPVISSLSPSSANAGAAAQTLAITGTGFISASTVTYNRAAHSATFVSSTQLRLR